MIDSKIAELFKTPANELVNIDPPKWRETFSDIHPQNLRLLSNSLINLSVLAARMSSRLHNTTKQPLPLQLRASSSAFVRCP